MEQTRYRPGFEREGHTWSQTRWRPGFEREGHVWSQTRWRPGFEREGHVWSQTRRRPGFAHEGHVCSQMRSCTPHCVAWPPIILKLERQAEWFEFFVGHVGASAFNNATPRRWRRGLDPRRRESTAPASSATRGSRSRASQASTFRPAPAPRPATCTPVHKSNCRDRFTG